jgi:protein-S-isoprenylcysteine O-methyltransferase Ste14
MFGKDRHDPNQSLNENIHHVLAHSYSTYFILFLVGLSLDLFFKSKVFTGEVVVFFGMILLGLGTLLVVWAQSTSRNIDKGNITKEVFAHGPYCFTRSPTHWGLFLLMLGFGLIANAFFVIILTIISFVLTRLIFLRKEEKLLVAKYGSPYLEYKRSVKF